MKFLKKLHQDILWKTYIQGLVEPRPIAPETWEKLPPEVQASILILENALCQSLDNIAQLEQKVNESEARLNRQAAAHHYRALRPLGSLVADQARS